MRAHAFGPGSSGITCPDLTRYTHRVIQNSTISRAQRMSRALRSASVMARPLLDGHGAKARAAGASVARRGGARVHQKGVSFRVRHALSFVPRQRGVQRGSRFDLPMGGTPMDQREFPLMARLKGPSVVPPIYVARCKSYREAVQMCWALRRVHMMTRRNLAEQAELRPQLVSDYLHPDDKPCRRDLPGDRIAQFEAVCGNTCVSQWIASNARLTVLEEIQTQRAQA